MRSSPGMTVQGTRTLILAPMGSSPSRTRKGRCVQGLNQPAYRFQLRRILERAHDQSVVDPHIRQTFQFIARLARGFTNERDRQWPADRRSHRIFPEVREDVRDDRALAAGLAIHAKADLDIVPLAVDAGTDPAV